MEKARILIVEDEAIICAEMKMTLESIGYDIVATTSNGESAIELAEKHRPDIILMDIRRDSPLSRKIQKKPFESSKVKSVPKLGGLQHKYEWKEVA